MKDILSVVLGCLLGLIIGFSIILGIGGLIAWGVGNAIIYLFNLNMTWTFLHGVLASFVLWGISFLVKNFLRIKIKKKE